MKVNYFGYYLKHTGSGTKTLFDLRAFLKEFSKLENTAFKNGFTHSDEHLYLLHNSNDIFLFLITRSNELIRKINTSDLSVDEVKNLLDRDEQLGFASYVIFREHSFGFGSTLLAPKVDVFARFINDIFESLGITDWIFVPQALLYQATKEEALSFDHIGRTTISLSKENTFIGDILATINVDTADTYDLDGLEIVIKPKARKNIKTTVDKFLQAIPDSGVEKMVMKAKAEGASQMTDLFIIGQGGISDSIDKSKEYRIPSLLAEKYEGNAQLQVKIQEFTGNADFQEGNVNTVLRFNHSDAWTSLISNLQQADGDEPRAVDESSSSEK